MTPDTPARQLYQTPRKECPYWKRNKSDNHGFKHCQNPAITATHTSATAPDTSTCYQTCPTCKQRVVTHCNIPAQMATEAAKAAREKVLDELLAWLEGHWTLTCVKHYGAWTIQQSLEYKTTIRKIESLRAQQQQGVSEG